MANSKNRTRRDREVILVRDLDDETLEAIRTAQPSKRSVRLNYLMDEDEQGLSSQPQARDRLT